MLDLVPYTNIHNCNLSYSSQLVKWTERKKKKTMTEKEVRLTCSGVGRLSKPQLG